MQQAAEVEFKRPAIRASKIVLPVEHGSWGFLFEPIVAATAIAFSAASLPIAVMVIGAFMMRRPLQIFLVDRLAGRSLPQTRIALQFVLIFFAVFAAGLAGSFLTSPLVAFLPFAVVAPFALYQIYCDASRKNRELAAELTGAFAMSSSAAAIALAGGFDWPQAAAIWVFFIARFVPSILYVRSRLRLEKGKPFSFAVPAASHLVALAVTALLWNAGLLPLLAAAVFVLLLVRSVIGLSRFRRPAKAMKIGVWEVIYGLAAVLSLIIGYHTGI
ncbi:MAG: YwiC-like family protein [Acidobacteria bacterium]|nr:YwiC-like family protein [Acidobacteriota bacterium]